MSSAGLSRSSHLSQGVCNWHEVSNILCWNLTMNCWAFLFPCYNLDLLLNSLLNFQTLVHNCDLLSVTTVIFTLNATYPALAQTPKYWKFKSAGLYLDEQICAHMKCPYKNKLYHNIQIISMSHTPHTNTALPLNPNNHHITNFMWDTII